MKPLRVLCLAAVALAPAACDPCFGVVLCNVAPRAVVTGRLLNDTTGQPERGATIDLVHVGGVSLAIDSVRVTTDDDGLFLIDVPAGEVGRVIADIVVRPRSGPGYRARGVSISTTTRGGEAFAMPPWSTIPHLPDFAEVFRRGGAREVIPNVEVEFRRTGGIEFRNLPSGVFRTTTNATGFVDLFGDKVMPVDAGEVIGDLTIFLPAPYGPSVHKDFRIVATPEFRRAAIIRGVGAGPSLNYQFQVRRRARPDVPVAGVVLEFQQTAGPSTGPTPWSITTDAAGNASFPGRASAAGTVIGNLTVKPPAPYTSYTQVGRQFPTFEADSIIATALGVGLWFPHYVIIRANGTPLKDARVDVRRVSGIAAAPSSFSATTDATGVVHLRLEPETAGEIVVDITVTPPPPHAAFTLRGVRLTAIDSDVAGGRTLLGDWDVTSPPTSAIRSP